MKTVTRPLLRRLQELHTLLASDTYPNAPELAARFEVSERTVRRDVDYLRMFCQAPIAFCRRNNGFHYTRPGYTLPLMWLTQGDLVALFLAVGVLRQCRGTPYEANLHQAVEKLVQALPEELRLDPAELKAALSVTPTAVTTQDVTVFAALNEAVVARERLDLTYWTAGRDEVTTRRVDPYHLNLRGGEWFLIAFCHLRQEVRMFAPQRVRSVQRTGEHFQVPADFDVQRYLAGCFGSVRGDGRYEVELWFPPAAAGRVAERIWHASQEQQWQEDGSLVLRMTLSDLREVKRWVLWWGAECRVLGPGELRREVEGELRRALGMYP